MSPFAHLRNKKGRLVTMLDTLASKKVMSVMCVMLLLLVVSYIAKTNSASGRGYEMRELDLVIRQLEHDTQRLELSIATQTASKELRSRAAQLGFHNNSDIAYIATAPAMVARR